MPKEGRDLWEAVRSSRPATVEDLIEQSRKRRENFQGGIQRLQHAAVQFAWVAGPMFLIFNVPRILFGRRKKRPPPDTGLSRVMPGRPGQQQMSPEEQKAYLQELMKQREDYMKKMQEAQLKAKLEARKAFLERQAQQEKEAKEKAEKEAAGEKAASSTDAADTPAPAAPKGLSGGLPVKGLSGGLPVKGMSGGLPTKPGAAAAAPAAAATAAAAAASAPAAAPRGLGGTGGLLPRGAAAKAAPGPAAEPAEPQPAEPKGLGGGLGLAPRKTSKPSGPTGFGKPAGLKGGLPPRAGLGRMAAAAAAAEEDDDDEWEEDDGTLDDAEEEEEAAPTEETAPAPAPAPAAAPVAPAPETAANDLKNFAFSGATADNVPLPDGSGWLVRRKMAADNSCLFNAVDYVKYGYKDSAGPAHAASQYGMQLRLVVANEVEDHPDKFNDAFLNMPNKQYVRWIQDPSNWGGGIELSILSEHFKMEIGAVNVRSKTCHVFGEASGYKQRALVIYDGNHYDAIAVASSPSSSPIKDETLFDPATTHGAAVMAAATKMAQLLWEVKSSVAGGPLMSLFGAS